MITIYHFTTNLSGGGAETQMILLANSSIIKQKYRNVIVYKSARDISFFENSYKDIQFVNFVDFKFVKKNSIVHIWIPDVFTYFPFLKFFKFKTIIGVRNIYEINSIKRLYQFFNLIFFRNFISNTSFNLQKQPFKYIFKNRNFTYIPNGVKFEPKKIDWNLKTNDFLYVGRLVKQKGIYTLFNVLKNISDLEIKIVGEGPLKHLLLGLLGQTHCLGYSNKVGKIYEQSKFLILPSYTEGMPNVVLESLCFGMIPILSDIPQHKDIFPNDSGVIYFKVGDSKSLEKAIILAKNLGEEELLKRRNMLDLLINKFTTQTMIKKYLKYYDELTEKN